MSQDETNPPESLDSYIQRNGLEDGVEARFKQLLAQDQANFDRAVAARMAYTPAAPDPLAPSPRDAREHRIWDEALRLGALIGMAVGTVVGGLLVAMLDRLH